MNTLKTILLGTTLSALMLSSLTTIEPANARGGGGHGGGGGGFRGGGDFDRGGDRGFGDRGFGDRGLGDRGFGDRGLGDDRFGRGDDGPLNHVSESALRDGADRLEVHRRGERETGLDDVSIERGQLLGHGQFLVEVHAGAGRLLAIPQRGIENHDLA